MLFVNISQAPIIIGFGTILVGLILFTLFRKKYIINSLFSFSQRHLLTKNSIKGIKSFKIFCLILASLMITGALLDPRGSNLSSDLKLEGIDIIMTFDVSRSMDATDISPSRLNLAKSLGEQLSDNLVGNRIGLVAFAADAFRLLPLTTDVNSINLFMQDLNTDMFSSQSTDIGKALNESIKNFSDDALTHKAIILFTDGENLDGDTKQAISFIKEKGISLFIIGLGTQKGGKIPIFDQKGNIIDSLHTTFGREVITKLDEKYLKNLANDTKGEYIHGSQQSLQKLIKSIDTLEKSPFGTNIQSFLEPQFRPFILIALLALLLYIFLPEQTITKKIFLIIIFCFNSNFLFGLGTERSAYSNYKKEEFSSALRFYQRTLAKNPKNLKAKFGEGATLYKLERGERAEKAFLALTNSENLKIAQQSLFNVGNSRLIKKDFTGALEIYKQVLYNNPTNSKLYQKALNNYIYTKALQQQKQQQQNNSNQQNDSKNNSQKDQQQDQQNDKQDSQTNNSTNQQNQENSTNKQSQESMDTQSSAPMKSVSPNDIDNLLGIAQEEEKDNLKRQKRKGQKGFQQNKW